MFTVSGFLVQSVALPGGTQETSSLSLGRGLFFVLVRSLRPRAAAHVRGRHLARASLVALQALQDALRQKFDVGVRLRVRVDQLQLLQAALLQEHTAVASGVLAADVLHGPGCPQLDTRGVEALQQGEERVK